MCGLEANPQADTQPNAEPYFIPLTEAHAKPCASHNFVFRL